MVKGVVKDEKPETVDVKQRCVCPLCVCLLTGGAFVEICEVVDLQCLC